MQNLRILVIDAPDAVPAVLAHDGVFLSFGVGLDGVADVPESRTRADRFDAAPHGLAAGLAEAPGEWLRRAHEVHAAGVAVKAVPDDRHVDVEDVSGL